MQRKNFKELKAVVKTKNVTIMLLKRVARKTEEHNKAVVKDYKIEIHLLEDEILSLKEELEESKRKKWYQFERI